jgi:RNA polymerase sigma-70 factor, ECF subfamily
VGEEDPGAGGPDRRGAPGDGLQAVRVRAVREERRGRIGIPPRAEESPAVVDRLFRHESGRAVATLIGALGGNFDAAEEAVQDAFVVALERWPRDGVPDNPGAWITRVARNKAIDRLRRAGTLEAKRPALEALETLRASERSTADDPASPGREAEELAGDDRLRLIFTCCHPALAPEARVALTLRTLGGLSTPEIARAFLVGEPAMQQRLVRAKRKIAAAGIRYEVPAAEHLPERLGSVLATLYLVFNEGYMASGADSLVRADLSSEAIRLTRVLRQVMPGEPEATALLALMLLHDSRRAARTDARGRMVLLEDQDRGLWDRARIEEGLALADEAARSGPRPYVIQARIAAEHSRAARSEDTDWARIVRLYDWLAFLAPSPIVELNRAVAVAMAEGPRPGLELVEAIEGLDAYGPYHTARAELLRRNGDPDAARAYERAIELAGNAVERSFLKRRRAELSTSAEARASARRRS